MGGTSIYLSIYPSIHPSNPIHELSLPYNQTHSSKFLIISVWKTRANSRSAAACDHHPLLSFFWSSILTSSSSLPAMADGRDNNDAADSLKQTV